MDKFVAQWTKKREMGKKAYILRYGVLYIGMISTVLFTLPELINEGNINVGFFIIRLFCFPTIGAMIVGQRWDGKEQKYSKRLAAAEGK